MPAFSILGGALGQSGAQAGGEMAMAAAREAAASAQHQSNVNYSNISPWISGGRTAIDRIGRLLGFGELKGEGGDGGGYYFDPSNAKATQDYELNAFKTSPGYQFRVDQGIKARDRSASARGMVLSGAQQKAIEDYGQGAASEEYNNYINQLYQMAGMGQGATTSLAGTNSGLTTAAGNWTTQGGIARGSAYERGANALASGIGQGVQNAMTGAYMFRKPLGIG